MQVWAGAHRCGPVLVVGQAGGWSSHGCVTQPKDKETVCTCDHLSFFTLLLVTTPLLSHSYPCSGPHVLLLGAQEQLYLLPGEPNPALTSTPAPSLCPRGQEQISGGWGGWKELYCGSSET